MFSKGLTKFLIQQQNSTKGLYLDELEVGVLVCGEKLPLCK